MGNAREEYNEERRRQALVAHTRAKGGCFAKIPPNNLDEKEAWRRPVRVYLSARVPRATDGTGKASACAEIVVQRYRWRAHDDAFTGPECSIEALRDAESRQRSSAH